MVSEHSSFVGAVPTEAVAVSVVVVVLLGPR